MFYLTDQLSSNTPLIEPDRESAGIQARAGLCTKPMFLDHACNFS